ncbi:MAG: hypothetical protein MZW92_65550 [Comamonadaceae bacterium]|nr:hypothetical protein [Comamonadaceae bacterium]
MGTSTACFIGYATRGPVGEPVLIASFDDYQRSFGGLREDNVTSRGDDMGAPVSAFFLNGGAKTYIVRAVAAGTATASSCSARRRQHHRPAGHRCRQSGHLGRRDGGALHAAHHR